MLYTTPALESINNTFEANNNQVQVQTIDNSTKTIESLITARKAVKEDKIAQTFFGTQPIFRPFWNPRGYTMPRDQQLFRMYNTPNCGSNWKNSYNPYCRDIVKKGVDSDINFSPLPKIINPFNPTQNKPELA